MIKKNHYHNPQKETKTTANQLLTTDILLLLIVFLTNLISLPQKK